MPRPSRLLALAAFVLLSACGRKPDADPNVLTVAATAVPHAEILEHVRPVLAREGVKLDVRVFNDYIQPNTQVAEGRIAISYFETAPYLAEYNKAHGTRLVTIAGIHVEPLGAYSRRYKSIAALPDGASVAIPNEASSSGRSLLLLQKAGLITLPPSAGPSATPGDIIANPHHLVFRSLEAATLPRVLDQVDLALINTNYALEAGLNPVRDALVIEGKDSPYVNFIVGLEAERNDPKVRTLVAALRSADVRQFLADRYHGAVLPAF